MTTFVFRRLLWGLFAAFSVTAIAFGVQFLASDPVLLMLGQEATATDIETLRRQLNLDLPIFVQYAHWVSSALSGDFGVSLRTQRPALGEVLRLFPATLTLALLAFLLSIAIAIPLGTIAASKPRGLVDRFTSIFAGVGQAAPIFWVGILLIILFAVRLKWLPVSGTGSWLHFILPTVTLAMYLIPYSLRVVRASVRDTLSNDFVRTAVAKGVGWPQVLLKHALRPALVPVIGVLAVQLGQLLGGTVVIEAVFAWPGVGTLAIRSILAGDFPVVQTIVVFMALIFVILTLIADIAVAVIDPRARLR